MGSNALPPVPPSGGPASNSTPPRASGPLSGSFLNNRLKNLKNAFSLASGHALIFTVFLVYVAAILGVTASATASLIYFANALEGGAFFKFVLFLALLLFLGRKLFGSAFCFLFAVGGEFFVSVPLAHMGVVSRFGERTGEVLDEGLHLKWPFDKVEHRPNKIVSVPGSNEFPSKDDRWLSASWSYQYRLDPTIKRNGRSVCLEVSDSDIRTGVSDALQEKLSSLGALYDADVLKRNQHALADFIECWLMLERQPQKDAKLAGLTGTVDAKDLLGFFKRNQKEVNVRLAKSKESKEEVSAVGLRYGIRVEVFSLPKIDYTVETKKAMEAKTQAQERKGAFDIRNEMIAKLMERSGVTFQQAADEVDISLDPRIQPSKISIQGDSGSVLLANLGNLVGGPQANESDKKGGRK